MHSAPSVSFPVGRCVWHERACALLAVLAGGLVVGAWPRLSAAQGAVAASAWLAWCVFAAWTLRRHPRGRLLFSAAPGRAIAVERAWAWQGAGVGAIEQAIDPPALVIDPQRCVLLRLAPLPGVPTWVWADVSRAPQDWLALRRALLWAAGQGAGTAGRSGIVPRA